MNNTLPTNENLQNSLKEHILKKIETGEVQMRSRAYFVMKFCILVFLVILVCATSVLLISYTLFSLHAGGQIFLLSFGIRGLYEFLLVFPWLILVFDIILLLSLDLLLKRFKFGYNRPILYLFLGTLVVITFFGSLVNLTSFHQRMMLRAENSGLGMAGIFYTNLERPHEEEGLFRARIIGVGTSTITVIENDSSNATATVIFPAGLVPFGLLQTGDEVFIGGELVHNQIQAYGIRKM